MMLLSSIIGIAAAALLLTAGYLFGVNRGYHARQQLRRQNQDQQEQLGILQQRISMSEENPDEALRSTVQELLTPLIRRERLSMELSQLQATSGRRSDLTALLDQIAEKGNFSAVLISDEDGWPVASSTHTKNMEKLSATASLLLLVADRITRDSSPAPLSLMVHDEANTITLCRVFRAGGHRLTLTAVSIGSQLDTVALDPALVKIESVLSNWKP